MKKIILLAAILFGTYTQAQNIAYTTNGGATIANDQVFTFNGLTETTGKMLINIKNNGSETFRFKIRVDDIIGNPQTGLGMGVQFCFSQFCFAAITEGTLYPAAPVALTPGASNDPTDHFWNEYGGENNNPVTYKFTVVEVDADGAIIQDNLLKFTYMYQPTASVTDFAALQNMGITLNSNVVKNNLDINANTAATLALFDVNGKQVKTAAIAEGTQNIDLSAISSGIYFAEFTTATNKASGIKIVKN